MRPGSAQQRRPDPERPLYFLHVPKTGGTSLSAWLDGHFAPGDVCPWRELGQAIAAPRERLRSYRLYRGHHGMYLPRLLGTPLAIVTIVRDPLSRSISHYRDIVSRVTHPLHERVRGLTFEEFVLGGDAEAELRNLQCRFLALDDIDGDYRAHQRMLNGDPDGSRRKYSDRAMLDRALGTLDACLVAGVCERIDEAAARLAAALGWPAPGPLPRANAATAPLAPEALTRLALGRVRELTALDQELYNAVLGRSGGGRAPPRPPSHIPS